MVETLRTGTGWALRIAAGLLERAADAVEPGGPGDDEDAQAGPLPAAPGYSDDEADDVEEGAWGVTVPEEALEMLAVLPPPPPPKSRPRPLAGSAAARLAAARGEE